MNNKDKKSGKEKESNEVKIDRGPETNTSTNHSGEEKQKKEQKTDNELLEPAVEGNIEDNPEYKTLKEQNETLINEVSELKDKLLRRAAEFENYKRRTENEHLNFLKYAGESFIAKILPVYDDLERSLSHIKESDNNNDSIVSGLKMILAKFNKILEEQGVKKIEAKGMPFDFNLHEALLQQTVQGIAPHTVIEVVEPGYMYKDKVIRHAKVIVSDENSVA